MKVKSCSRIFSGKRFCCPKDGMDVQKYLTDDVRLEWILFVLMIREGHARRGRQHVSLSVS